MVFLINIKRKRRIRDYIVVEGFGFRFGYLRIRLGICIIGVFL